MRIGMDASWAATSGTGTASYTRGLIDALQDQQKHEFVLYFRPGDEGSNPLWQSQGHRTIRKVVGGPGQVGRSLVALAAAAERDRLDLFHSPGYFLPLWRGQKVVTFHDVNMFQQWDKWWRPGIRRSWLALCGQTLLSSRMARMIVADSEYSASEIRRVLRLPAERVRVIYPGVDDRYFTNSDVGSWHAAAKHYGLEHFILMVGVLSPQKNLAGAVEALSRLADRKIMLALVGKEDGPYYQEVIRPLVLQLGLEERVRHLGMVPDDTLRSLYAVARLVVHVSFAEGFGLPPLEAMACGAPVIASNCTSLPEVLGDAALLVDPYNTDEIRDAIGRLLDDDALRNVLVARGRRRAQTFRWPRAAQRMIELYESVA